MSDHPEKDEEERDEEPESDEPGSMPFFQDMPPRHVKGSRRTIFFFILLVVLAPLVLGGLFLLLRSLVWPGY